METAVMARKRAARAEPKRRAMAVAIKGSAAWKDWIEEAASYCRMSVSALIDVAVTQYVMAQGFPKRPPER
jgi:hypothetical protein